MSHKPGCMSRSIKLKPKKQILNFQYAQCKSQLTTYFQMHYSQSCSLIKGRPCLHPKLGADKTVSAPILYADSIIQYSLTILYNWYIAYMSCIIDLWCQRSIVVRVQWPSHPNRKLSRNEYSFQFRNWSKFKTSQ